MPTKTPWVVIPFNIRIPENHAHKFLKKDLPGGLSVKRNHSNVPRGTFEFISAMCLLLRNFALS